MCPNCGHDQYACAHIEERPFLDAACDATMLRATGQGHQAMDVLVRLAAVRLKNWLTPRWRCEACGVLFDE